MTVSERLGELVIASGLSKADVARRSGFKQPDRIYQILDGRRPNPSADTLLKILGALDLDWDALKGASELGCSNVR